MLGIDFHLTKIFFDVNKTVLLQAFSIFAAHFAAAFLHDGFFCVIIFGLSEHQINRRYIHAQTAYNLILVLVAILISIKSIIFAATKSKQILV